MWFIVLTFIILIAVIFIADDLTTALLIVSMITHFLIISSRLGKCSIAEKSNAISAADGPKLAELTKEEPTGTVNGYPADTLTNPYCAFDSLDAKREYDYFAHNLLFPQGTPDIPASPSVHYDIDSRKVQIAQAANRDKRTIDGAVTKTADYYKYHFHRELDESEAKQWWGNREY